MAGPFVFNSAIPQPTDKISDSQSELLTNNASLESFLEINHVPFNNNDAGKHIFVTLPVYTGEPGTGGSKVAMFSAIGDYSGNVELYLERANDGPILNFTESELSSPGWSYLPSGLLIKWGGATISGTQAGMANTGAVPFPMGDNIPVFNTVFAVYTTISPRIGGSGTDPNLAIYLSSYNTTSFTCVQWRRDDSGIGGTNYGSYILNYFAIGM